MKLVSTFGVGLFIAQSHAFGPLQEQDKSKTVEKLEGSDLYPVSVFEYDRTDVLLCGGNQIREYECWDAGNGKSYRYGCNSGDSRIYTNECDSSNCDPSTCSTDFTWESETENLCFDDKEVYFNYKCHAPELNGTKPNASGAVAKYTTSKTCAELGWPLDGGSLDVCATSKMNGTCMDNTDLKSAKQICENMGGRLCTPQELLRDEARGTGCKGDTKRVWTSKECAGGYISTAGSSKSKDQFAEECTVVTTKLQNRCCADTFVPKPENGTNGSVNRDNAFPSGYKPAISREYTASISCGNPGLATKSYNCYASPNGKYQRFACRDSSDYIWTQDCDADCVSCSGQWYTQSERVGKCYYDPNAGSALYYDYECGN